MMNQLKHRRQYWTVNNKDQTGSRERTGSCSGIDLENVVRATQTTTDHIEESELELTLSIGLSSSSTTMTTTTNKDMDYSSTTSMRSSSDNCNNQSNNNNNNSNNNQESSGPNTPMSSSSTTSLDREKKRPHWLFQGLSINRTSSWFLLIHWLFLFSSSWFFFLFLIYHYYYLRDLLISLLGLIILLRYWTDKPLTK